MIQLFKKGDVNLPSSMLFWVVVVAVAVLVVILLVMNWGGASSGLIDKLGGIGIVFLLPDKLLSCRRG